MRPPAAARRGARRRITRAAALALPLAVLVGTGSAIGVGLSADPAVLDPDSPFVTLQASHGLLGPGESIAIYNDAGALMGSSRCNPWPTGASSCAQSSDYIPSGIRSYSAFVVTGTPPATAPASGGSEVTVRHPGWQGNLDIVSDRSTGGGTATFQVSTSKTTNPPWGIVVYGPARQILPTSRCTQFPEGAVNCVQTSFSMPTGFSGTFNAYVSQDAPTTGPPAKDVRAHASVTFTNGSLNGRRTNGVNWTTFEQRLNALSDAEIVLIMSGVPSATNRQSTVSDQGLAFQVARQAGVSKIAAFRRAVFGSLPAAMLAAYVWEVDIALTPGATYSAPPAPPTSAVTIPAPSAPGSDVPQRTRSFRDWLSAQYQRRAQVSSGGRVQGRGYEVSVQASDYAADQCLQVTRRAISLGKLEARINGKHPCDPGSGVRIYFPTGGEPYPAGRLGTATVSAAHDYDAVVNVNPSWVSLNYVSQVDRAARGLSRSWYGSTPPCLAGTYPGQDCHEFPYYATRQSGPGAKLQVIARDDNRANGMGYQRFTGNVVCPLASGGPLTLPLASEPGTRFLIVPLPRLTSTPSFFACP